MPPLARWYVKLGLIYLVLALLVGAVRAAEPLVWVPPALVAAGPTQLHLFVVGWITQMIFGVAYWMFPKYAPDLPRGHDAVAVATFVLLNLGLLLRAVAEPLFAVHAAPALGRLLLVSALAQWLAGVGFVANTWPRVKVK